MPELPTFAQQWVQQWKDAAPRLQAIRDEELRRLGDASSPLSGPVSGIVGDDVSQPVMIYEKYPHSHGMVIMQQWFLRRHALEQAAKLAEPR